MLILACRVAVGGGISLVPVPLMTVASIHEVGDTNMIESANKSDIRS